MTTAYDIEKQLDVIEAQFKTLQGWQLDSGALAVARADTLVSLAGRLQEMILDAVANPPKKSNRPLPPLGSAQKGFLRSVLNYGPYGSSSWVWGSDSQSRRLAESLAKRGLLLRDVDPDTGRGDYILTVEGRREIERIEESRHREAMNTIHNARN
jgi:hypothetical protein